MSGSDQPVPNQNRRHRPSDVGRETTSTKFTAVNRSPPSPTPPLVFGFRPDQSSPPEAYNKPVKSQNEAATSDEQRTKAELESPVQHKPFSAESRADPTNDKSLAKRKRSLDCPPSKDVFEGTNDSRPSKKGVDAFERSDALSLYNSAREPVRIEDNYKKSRFPLSESSHCSPSRQGLLPSDLAPLDEDAMSSSPEDPGFSSYTVHPSDTQQSLESSDNTRPGRKRQFTKRTKTGCITCRKRKKKCDEGKPFCQNCLNGNFQCQGYGERKTPNGVSSQNRINPPLLSKGKERERDGPIFSGTLAAPRGSPWPEFPQVRPPFEGSRSYEGSHSDRRDSWVRSWPTESPMASTASRISGSSIPPVSDLFRERDQGLENDRLASAAQFGQSIAPASLHTRFGAQSSLNLYQPSLLSHFQDTSLTEKDKMVQGKPYKAFTDPELYNDEKLTRGAVERYNNATRPSQGASDPEIGRLFLAIVAKVGDRTTVKPPFTCDYGYNIFIGSEVVIGENCKIQAPCKVSIGDHTIIGPDAKFYGRTYSMDARARNGNQGRAIGYPITIEEDVLIEGNVTIGAGVTIKRGAIVRAGTVLTEDVQTNTVVAGNPMKVERGVGPSEDLDVRRPDSRRANDDMGMGGTDEGFFHFPDRRR